MAGGNAFAFGGAVIGGAIGSFGGPAGIYKGAQIGATIGTVAGAIFSKPQDAAKGRDTRWGGATYGTSISRGWGTHRTDAPIFWGVRNPKDGSYLFPQDQKKGKGKGSQNVKHFRATFAFYILETGLTYCDDEQTQVERRIVIDRVWMADKIVWQSASAVPIPAWSSSVTYAYGDHVTRSGHTYVSVADLNLNHTPPTNSNSWWQKVSTGKNWDIRFHPDDSESTFTMAVDSIMASHDGIANTSAQRGGTYGVVNNQDTFDVGNTLPQNASVEWHWADACYLRDLLNDACGLSGMPLGSYDFSDVPDVLTGYRQTARQSGQDLVSSPLAMKAFDLASIDGVVRAIKRGGSIAFDIPAEDLGGCNEGEIAEPLEESILADPSDLHSSIRVGYFDASAGFRQDFQPASRNTHEVENPTDLPSDLVMTVVEGAQTAGRLLDTEWLENGGTFGISLLGDYSALVGTDRVRLPRGGRLQTFRVLGTEFEQNHVKAQLARDEVEVLNRYESGSTALATSADDGTIKPTALLVLSPANDLSNEFATYPGFYPFVNGPEGWLGGQLVFTFDAPAAPTRDWVDGPFVADASTFGLMTSALATAAAGYETADSATLTVAIDSAMVVPASTFALVSNGAQNAIVGNEIVGVVGATDLGGGSYQIGPGLIRGMRGSDTSGHASGEPFAAAPSVSSTVKVRVDAQYVGQTVYVRALSPGQDIDDAPEVSCVISAPTSPYVTSLPTYFQETPSGAVDGLNATFALSHAPIAGSLVVYVAGAATTAYTITGTSIAFSSPPAAGSALFATYSY